MSEDNFTFDPVNFIPTDELIDELLNRFPACIIGYVDEDQDVVVHWEGCYATAVGLSVLLSDNITLENEVL